MEGYEGTLAEVNRGWAHGVTLAPWSPEVGVVIEEPTVFEALDGGVVVMAHADGEGRLDDRRVRILRPTVVVCCHPAAVRRRHPDLPVVGDWEGRTFVARLDREGRIDPRGGWLMWREAE